MKASILDRLPFYRPRDTRREKEMQITRDRMRQMADDPKGFDIRARVEILESRLPPMIEGFIAPVEIGHTPQRM